MKSDITIYTIAFNGYGRFVKKWLEPATNQTIKPKEVIVVLSDNHGLQEFLDNVNDVPVKYIETPIKSMGELQNEAIKRVKTEWMIFCDVDDYFYTNAVEEIQKKQKEADCIMLKSKSRNGEYKFPKFTKDNLMDWSFSGACGKHGYTAYRKTFKGETMYFIDSNFPNIPLMQKACAMGMRMTYTDNVCVYYDVREGSHTKKVDKKKRLEVIKMIRSKAKEYGTRYLSK